MLVQQTAARQKNKSMTVEKGDVMLSHHLLCLKRAFRHPENNVFHDDPDWGVVVMIPLDCWGQ